MRIFITGGTGFVGKFVVKKIDNGKNKILLLTNKAGFATSKNICTVSGSLSDIEKWENILIKFNPEVVIHLAWEGIPDFSITQCRKNLKYGLDLIKVLTKTACRTILITGSLWEYGNASGKLSENLDTQSINAFTTAKNSLNFLGSKIAKKKNINFIWARLFYVYGPGQRENSIIPYLIKCVKENKIPEIRNPKAKNDFIYVEDVADAISKLILEYNQSNTFNIGSGKLTSIQTVISKINDKFGVKKAFKKTNQIQTDVLTANYADITKIKKAINWQPEINLEKGLATTIDSY